MTWDANLTVECNVDDTGPHIAPLHHFVTDFLKAEKKAIRAEAMASLKEL